MQINVKADLKEAQKYLRGLSKDQVPFATAYALTKTAKQAQKHIITEMRRVFDRPKPYTLNGTFVIAAKKNRLRAVVKLKDGYLGEAGENSRRGTADKYLAPQIQGGARRPKAFEKLLINKGLMPPGMFAVPTSACPLDRFGNVSAGYFNRVMSQLRIATDPLSNTTQRSRRRRRTRTAGFFVAYPGRERTSHLKPGIYERTTTGFGGGIRPIFIYTDTPPKYRVRLRFDQIVLNTVADYLGFYFEKGFKVAQATARSNSPASMTAALMQAGVGG